MKNDLKLKLTQSNSQATNFTNEPIIEDINGNTFVDPNRIPTNFKGIWIPKEIFSLIDINEFEKMLLSEISGLANNGICFASNEYFAKLFGKDERTISRAISKLKNRGYVSEIGSDGRKRYLKSNFQMTLKRDT